MSARPLRILHASAGNLYGGVETLLATLAREATPGMIPEYALCFAGRTRDELVATGAPVHLLNPVKFRLPWTVWQARREFAKLVSAAHPLSPPCKGGAGGVDRDRTDGGISTPPNPPFARGGVLFDSWSRNRFDAVICHGCWPHALFGPVVRRAGLPLVFWLHDLPSGTHWIERRAARTAPDLALAGSRCAAATMPRLFPHAPVAVVAPPLARRVATGARDAVRSELATPTDAVVVLIASRLDPLKGHDLLLDALGALRDRPGWVAWIAGGAQRPHEQTYLGSLKSQAEHWNIADRVRFLGHRTDIPRVLSGADLLCQPNRGPESFGLAFVEALDAGLPVITTRIGGGAEIVTDDCGALVTPDDPEALAATLAALIDDGSARAGLGAAGPARARGLCDPAIVLDRLEDLLRKVTERHDEPTTGHDERTTLAPAHG